LFYSPFITANGINFAAFLDNPAQVAAFTTSSMSLWALEASSAIPPKE
jgi:hypothetical protein